MSDEIKLSFKLPDNFISKYKDREVDWGFKDAGENAFSEIIFLRTYSRLKPDGTKERWWEVCQRVIEGMFSIQKDHCKSSRLPWNDRKAQATAQDAYDRLFTFKWTPPGRGLWMMGTALVNEKRVSTPLQNCFTADTKFITRNGVSRLGDEVGKEIEVWAGDWFKATVQSFGVQNVQRITFAPFHRRSNHRVVEIATPNHRWELRDGSLTTNLKVGDIVPSETVDDAAALNPEAYRHGLIFADGSINYTYKNGDFSHMMRLCGDKAAKVGYFENVHYQPNCNGDPVVYYRSATNMKKLPETSDSDYLQSFIAGWLAFDGTEVGGGNRAINTQDADAVVWLKEYATFAGYNVVGVNILTTNTNYGLRSAPLYKITLSDSLDYWTVKSIEPLDEPEEVFCAVVPDVERFTLASGIYTSNCAFVSTGDMTKTNPSEVFQFMMEASMLGIGVGFDTKGSEKGISIRQPKFSDAVFVIPDTREGWVESLGIVLNAYLMEDHELPLFDYSQIRPAGTIIKTFGGVASGSEPLENLHLKLNKILGEKIGQTVDSRMIADIGNLVGLCVVSGNVRRSAELLLGSIEDNTFLNLKNYEGIGSERSEWSWLSNNSVTVSVGDDLSKVIEGISRNGEPGVVWMDISRSHGRLIDPPNYKDHRAMGYNPCAEQTLESFEMCTLVETYLSRHETLDDFKKTLKVAYLYGKTVTLLPTHFPRTNAIMQRNRRIGTSMSGIANFADNRGLPVLREWMDQGYQEVIRLDKTYSEWLCVRESIKTTTVKPSGTVSILAGESPGVHWSPGGEYYYRLVRFSKMDPMLSLFKRAGYTVEDAVSDPEVTAVVYFPIHCSAKRSERDVTLFEKASLAATAQRYWSDNSVSVTLSFDPETEQSHVGPVLGAYEGQLKTVSFLPMLKDGAFAQMPYTHLSKEDYHSQEFKLWPVDLTPIYDGLGVDAEGEAFCSTDACLIKEEVADITK